MVYAKQMKDGVVVALLTYNYNPQFSPYSNTVVITEEEYNELYAAFEAEREQSGVVTDQISAAEALAIITGEVTEDDA